MKIMAWNIFHGGREPDESNVGPLTEVIAGEQPDVLVVVETYGSGQLITDALNSRAPQGVHYTGQRITQAEPGRDNLWIFHRYQPVRTYLDPAGIGTFHFGGVRLRTAAGLEFNVFACWLNYLSDLEGAMEAEIAAIREGRPRPYGDAALAAIDTMTLDPVTPAPEEKENRPEESRLAQARRILDSALPGFLGEDTTTPTIIAGDLNCLSHRDWTAADQHLPRHHGMVLEWPVPREFEAAGFTDTYRVAHPDASTHPGMTWSPYGGLSGDYRIDYILSRGEGMTVRDARIIDSRLPEHGAGKFYSDHAAQITEMEIAGE